MTRHYQVDRAELDGSQVRCQTLRIHLFPQEVTGTPASWPMGRTAISDDAQGAIQNRLSDISDEGVKQRVTELLLGLNE